MVKVYRVQDKGGRGPFKPGLSHIWLDGQKSEYLKSWIEEFGVEPIRMAMGEGRYLGCACRSVDELKRWFSRAERRRLKKLGYNLVSIDVDEVVMESDIQLVFRRGRPLSEGVVLVKWEEMP